MIRTILMSALALTMSGCIVIPLPSKPDPTARFSRAELAFLEEADATRKETLSTLGLPAVDLADPGVMVYTRAAIDRTLIIPPGQIGCVETGLEPAVLDGPRREWALLIAYDSDGHILAHQVREFEGSDLNGMGLKWRAKISSKRFTTSAL